ncbi:GntR family transcriptional regulator [Desulfovibrio sp. Huiquan2017]|uniref:GntR family transcriptional regulator n=1 Tax=Desulfovibrio sp. Huiquan2017 TaxID=2816861 RepID=UPI001A91256B|nr:GntR family transcriptional regulator [Desulfovibrio sp. Huiquan2017]
MLSPPKKNKYIEIAEQFIEQVVEGSLSPGDKIASVRETAIRMGVTPNTAANAHAHLRNLGIIRPLHGKGSVVTDDAPSICRAYIETLFTEHEIPIIRQRASLLGLSEQQILELLKSDEAHKEKS